MTAIILPINYIDFNVCQNVVQVLNGNPRHVRLTGSPRGPGGPVEPLGPWSPGSPYK